MPPRLQEQQPATGAQNPARRVDEMPDDAVDVEKRNIVSLVIHQILFRTAWIFKTESVIIPAFLDSISDAGWVRGMFRHSTVLVNRSRRCCFLIA